MFAPQLSNHDLTLSKRSGVLGFQCYFDDIRNGTIYIGAILISLRPQCPPLAPPLAVAFRHTTPPSALRLPPYMQGSTQDFLKGGESKICLMYSDQ